MTQRFSTVSPIDGSVLWEGPESTPDEVADAVRRGHQAWPAWRRTPPERRFEIVRAFAERLTRHRDDVVQLISREVGKLPGDAEAEVAAALAKPELSIRAFRERRSTEVAEDGGVRRVVRYRPIGLSLVLGPFNFPLHLPGGQIIPLLLAGNPVLFKPSDQATLVGRRMVELWHDAGLPPDVLGIVTGGVDPALAAIDAGPLAGVFLTGGRAAGEAIHRRLAGRPAVQLALELGGNNPVVVIGDPPTGPLANLITYSAFISSGQRCTSARRAIFVRGEATRHQIDAVVARARELPVGVPGDDPPPRLGPLISDAAADAIWQTYLRFVELGCQPLLPMVEPASGRRNLVAPAIVDASGLPEPALREIGETEWFGPLLVVERCDDFDAAFAAAARTPYGLAASLVGGTAATFEAFVDAVPAGVCHWNRPTTGAAGVMPFGGLGASGNHRPAGFHMIDSCGDPVASIESQHLDTSDPWPVE